MATVKGVQRTNLDAEPKVAATQGTHESPVRTMSDKYTFTGVHSSGDIVEFGAELPKGAKILGYRLVVPALGGSCDGKL